MRRTRRRAGGRLLPILLALGALLTIAVGPTAAAGTGGGCLSCTTTTYYVDSIYKTYDGFYDISTGHGCIGPCVISVTETESWSNTWGASIEFKKDPITVKVGYDVTSGGSRSFTYSFNVPAGKTGVVRYQDWFHVSDMYVHSVTCGKTCSTTYGTAWAAKWYQRIFYLST